MTRYSDLALSKLREAIAGSIDLEEVVARQRETVRSAA